MLWSDLRKYFFQNDDDITLTEDGYIGFVPNEDYIIEIEDDNGEMLVSDYTQLWRDPETGKDVLIFQVLVDSENPINIATETNANDTIITANIYKRIRHLDVD